ncbi:MAG: hypothetical protein MZV64_35235 [Ignavibacteriales bacterium]|nr:hypothetical protein [Ignavibacteriales bacterium]
MPRRVHCDPPRVPALPALRAHLLGGLARRPHARAARGLGRSALVPGGAARRSRAEQDGDQQRARQPERIRQREAVEHAAERGAEDARERGARLERAHHGAALFGARGLRGEREQRGLRDRAADRGEQQRDQQHGDGRRERHAPRSPSASVATPPITSRRSG